MPRLGDALGWLGVFNPVRVLMHEAVAKQLEDADLPVVKVSASDAKAATAVLRDGACGVVVVGCVGGAGGACAGVGDGVTVA